MDSTRQPTKESGVIYYAVGSRFAREAERSAASVRRHMPKLPTAIFADCPVDAALFDHVIAAPEHISMKQLKMHALLASPFARSLYLDTDTLLLSPVWEVFDVLDTFDVAMSLAPGYTVFDGPTGRSNNGIPAAYPRWNGGVIAMRRSPEAIGLIESWTQAYQSMGKQLDQPSLRVAAFHSNARVAPLPYSYNYRLSYPGGVRGTVKILHGRDPDLTAMQRKINKRTKMRATVPRSYKFGMIVHGDSRPINYLRKLWWHARSSASGALGKHPAVNE